MPGLGPSTQELATDELVAQTELGPVWLGRLAGQAVVVRALLRGQKDAPCQVRRAVRRTARVAHPALTPVLGYGAVTPELSSQTSIEVGRLFVASPPPWPRNLDSAPMTWPRLRGVVDQLLEGLGALHSHGLVHGEVGPATIEVDGDQARLRDTGLRRALVLQGLLPDEEPGDALGDLTALARALGPRSEELQVPEGWSQWLDRLARRRIPGALAARRELAALEGIGDAFSPVLAQAAPILREARGLVGREAQLRTLWDTLSEVRRGSTRVLVLQGSGGCGRSALANWLVRAARQKGLATVMRARYSATGAVRDGLGHLVVHHLGCEEGPALERDMAEALRGLGMTEPWELRGLTSLATAMPQSPADARTRHGLLRRFLKAAMQGSFKARRPLLLVLEEVQWGLESITFAHTLLRSADMPVLVLLTLGRDEVQWDGRESAAVAALLDQDGAELLNLPPLAADDLARIASSRVDEQKARRLAVAARGNPLYLEQLLLGGRPQPAESLGAALLDRIEERPLRFALELLACLGMEAPIEEWRQVCQAWGLQPETEWLETLADADLVALSGTTVRFRQVSLRRALLTSAEREGRLSAHHSACAAVLGQLEPRNGSARIGEHHAQAGDPHLAIPCLLDGASDALLHGRTEHCLRLLADATRAVDRVREGVDEQHRARLLTLRAEALLTTGQLLPAAEAAEKAVQRARWSAGNASLGRALAVNARSLRQGGELGQALGCLREAETLLEGTELARIHHQLGQVLADLGAMDDAAACFQGAREGFMVGGDRAGLADSLRALGDLSVRRGDVAWAATLLEAARQAYSELGSAWGAAACHNSLGELWRRKGDLEGAERHYRAAGALSRGHESIEGLVTDLNRGMVLELQGRHGEAQALLRACLDRASRSGARLLQATCHIALLPALAGSQDWPAMDSHFALGVSLLAETAYVDEDLALLALRAADASEGERRRQLLGLAVGQYRQLGRQREVADLQVRLNE